MTEITGNIKRIGIDFDNTIVTYDDVFYTHALRLGLVDHSVKKTKQSIRYHVRLLENCEPKWIELQAIVYGYYIKDAEPAPGIERFLAECKNRGIRISIISHKTRYPAMGPQYDLREAARKWIGDRGFLQGYDIAEDDVVFVGTLAEKFDAIKACGCDIYIDDLDEVLEHPDFPAGVRKILYSTNTGPNLEGITRFGTWGEIHEYLFG